MTVKNKHKELDTVPGMVRMALTVQMMEAQKKTKNGPTHWLPLEV
jgi:hypothetical protein